MIFSLFYYYRQLSVYADILKFFFFFLPKLILSTDFTKRVTYADILHICS